MRAAVLCETPLLIELLTLVGLATTSLLDWLLTFVSISLYGIFLRGQVGRYRNLFIENRQSQPS